MREPSSVLQNRRERLEELTLEAQEMRAKRELVRLQREDQMEAERREAEEDARASEAAERQVELELERERLEHECAQERASKLGAGTWARAAFRCHWLEEVNQALGDPQCDSLSAGQKKKIIDAVEAEIEKKEAERCAPHGDDSNPHHSRFG